MYVYYDCHRICISILLTEYTEVKNEAEIELSVCVRFAWIIAVCVGISPLTVVRRTSVRPLLCLGTLCIASKSLIMRQMFLRVCFHLCDLHVMIMWPMYDYEIRIFSTSSVMHTHTHIYVCTFMYLTNPISTATTCALCFQALFTCRYCFCKILTTSGGTEVHSCQ